MLVHFGHDWHADLFEFLLFLGKFFFFGGLVMVEPRDGFVGFFLDFLFVSFVDFVRVQSNDALGDEPREVRVAPEQGVRGKRVFLLDGGELGRVRPGPLVQDSASHPRARRDRKHTEAPCLRKVRWERHFDKFSAGGCTGRARAAEISATILTC